MIIQSLLDTDLYKFTMQQVVWSQFPQATVDYEFACRNDSLDLRPYADEIQAEIENYCTLSLTDEEAAYLRTIRFIKHSYVESLTQLRLNPAHIHITAEGGFRLRVSGNWFQCILFEVPILAIVNEVFFRHNQPNAPDRDRVGIDRLREKCRTVNQSDVPVKIIEFGTRRRYSREWQQTVLQEMKERIPGSLLGTSNVHLARTLQLKSFGTMAHEFLQACQTYAPLPEFQRYALESWMQAYRGDLGIALSDVVGMDAFLRDFDLLFSKAYDGCRHDSGDPFVWGDKLIAHYEKFAIDPKLKTAVFSDGLTIARCIELASYFKGRIRTQFGIGTHLTNDFDFPALNIVLKMTRCNGRPVAKISDSPGKMMSSDTTYLDYLRQSFQLPTV